MHIRLNCYLKFLEMFILILSKFFQGKVEAEFILLSEQQAKEQPAGLGKNNNNDFDLI